ncbi:MAG: DUF1648 domain-containing protein [Oscillospiraceae bacterium]|nr:DUF1648 domain-containing protein [Oscillospiraceae bacterium]
MPKGAYILLGKPERVYHIVIGVLSPLLQIAVLVWLAVMFRDLPDKVPTHYDFSGEVTGWGGKGTLWMLPIIGIAVDIGMWGAQFLPRSAMNTGVRMTARNSEYVYGCAKDLMVDIRFGLSALFASMSVPLIRGREPGTVSWIIVAAAIIVPVVRYAVRVSKAKYL